jgi:hypothetical protein
VKRTKKGNLGFCAASIRNGERHLLMPAAFGDDVRSGRWTRGYTGELYSGPHRFDVPMQEAAFEWLPRHFSVRAMGRGEMARLSPDSRLLLCCALPRRVVFGETIQPNRERYRGQH